VVGYKGEVAMRDADYVISIVGQERRKSESDQNFPLKAVAHSHRPLSLETTKDAAGLLVLLLSCICMGKGVGVFTWICCIA
jgi:hypothetical protein